MWCQPIKLGELVVIWPFQISTKLHKSRSLSSSSTLASSHVVREKALYYLFIYLHLNCKRHFIYLFIYFESLFLYLLFLNGNMTQWKNCPFSLLDILSQAFIPLDGEDSRGWTAYQDGAFAIASFFLPISGGFSPVSLCTEWGRWRFPQGLLLSAGWPCAVGF